MDAEAFLATLPPFDGIQRLDPLPDLTKDAVLDAEVTLPLAQGVDVSALRWVRMRPPRARDSRVLLVDVSRLSAP